MCFFCLSFFFFFSQKKNQNLIHSSIFQPIFTTLFHQRPREVCQRTRFPPNPVNAKASTICQVRRFQVIFCRSHYLHIFALILGGKFKFKDSIRERFSHEFESLDTSRSHKLERHSESRRSIDGWTDESKAAKVKNILIFVTKRLQI